MAFQSNAFQNNAFQIASSSGSRRLEETWIYDRDKERKREEGEQKRIVPPSVFELMASARKEKEINDIKKLEKDMADFVTIMVIEEGI